MHIDLVPIGGLCNRMRAMASGVRMSEVLNGTCHIRWAKNRDCFADFDELFQPVTLSNITVSPISPFQLHFAVSRKKNLYLPGLIRKFMYDAQWVWTKEQLDDAVFQEVKAQKMVVISGYSLTAHFPLRVLFRPQPELQDRIEAVCKRFTPNTLGVHIRRGDNQMSIQNNPSSDYFHFMDAELLRNPEVRFYLATDSDAIKSEMAVRYGDKLFFSDAQLRRDSLQGMKDAVVDLWCLAATSRIIGSYYSSYSDLAAEMGDVELVILDSKK
jgi:hypothetical protein